MLSEPMLHHITPKMVVRQIGFGVSVSVDVDNAAAAELQSGPGLRDG